MTTGDVVRRGAVGPFRRGTLLHVVIAAVALALMSPKEATADECGTVPCTDITTDYTIHVTTNVMRDMRTDCSSVTSVRLLDKSIDDRMMIYSVRCDDGAGEQLYQLLYWVADGEMNINKFTGTSMRSLTKRYNNKVGLEKR